MCAHKVTVTAVELTILASGSAGNAALLATSTTRILIDAGISRRKLRRRVEEAGLPNLGLSAVCLTHEHTDHSGHAAKISDEYGCPVYLSDGTAEAMEANGSPPLMRKECFDPGEAFSVGDITVTPFQVPHDAKDPVGFRFETGGVCLAFALDLGRLTTLIRERFRDCRCLVLEANYDVETLRSNKLYPEEIKQRIWSSMGHLSNDNIRDFLRADFDGAAKDIVLAHLSENNNLPELAEMAAREGLERWTNPAVGGTIGNGQADSEYRVHVAPRDAVLPTLRF